MKRKIHPSSITEELKKTYKEGEGREKVIYDSATITATGGHHIKHLTLRYCARQLGWAVRAQKGGSIPMTEATATDVEKDQYEAFMKLVLEIFWLLPFFVGIGLALWHLFT